MTKIISVTVQTQEDADRALSVLIAGHAPIEIALIAVAEMRAQQCANRVEIASLAEIVTEIAGHAQVEIVFVKPVQSAMSAVIENLAVEIAGNAACAIANHA